MALKINRKLQKIINIVGWILIIAAAICMIKILVWENNYYKTKSAEHRATADVVITKLATADNPSEETPNLDEYQVEATKPRYLTIERLDLKVRIKESTVNSETLAVPQNIHDAMWSAGSSKPGENGVLLLTGLTHGASESSKGAFANLDSLEKGNSIKIELGNGETYSYKVAEIRIVNSDDAENELPSIQRRIDDKETLSLITAREELADDENTTYTSIVIVRATKE